MTTELAIQWSTFWNGTIDSLTRANDQLVLDDPDFGYVLRQLSRIEEQRRKMIEVINVHLDRLDDGR